MSGGEVGRPSSQDLQTVKNLIERCLQLYMSRKETVNVLSREANVMPSITELLWQRLEAENQEFFEVYYMRLALKEQVERFNALLKQQDSLMKKVQSAAVAPMPVSNGSRVTQFQQNAGCFVMNQTGPSMRPESLQPNALSLSNSFSDGVSPMQTPAAFNLSTPSRTVDCLPNTLRVQNSNSLTLMHGLNGGIVKSESGYPSDTSLFYSTDPHLGELHRPIEDSSIAAFGGLEASSQPLNDTLLGVNGSFGQLEHIPKLFSLPELPYPNMLDNYTNSTFMMTNGGEIAEDNKGMITESYSNYEEFGSE